MNTKNNRIISPDAFTNWIDAADKSEQAKTARKTAIKKFAEQVAKARADAATSAAIEKELAKWQENKLCAYSPFNSFLIVWQCLYFGKSPNDVRGLSDWKRGGYELKKGAHKIFIFAPCFSDKTSEKEAAEAVENGEAVQKKGRFFRVDFCYSISDVEKVRDIKRRVRKVVDDFKMPVPDIYAPAALSAPAATPKQTMLPL